MSPEHPSHREQAPASEDVTWVSPSQDGAITTKNFIFFPEKIIFWLIKDMYNLYKCSAEKLDKQAPSGHGSDSSASKG